MSEEHLDQSMQVSGEQDLVNPNRQMGTQSTGFSPTERDAGANQRASAQQAVDETAQPRQRGEEPEQRTPEQVDEEAQSSAAGKAPGERMPLRQL